MFTAAQNIAEFVCTCLSVNCREELRNYATGFLLFLCILCIKVPS